MCSFVFCSVSNSTTSTMLPSRPQPSPFKDIISEWTCINECGEKNLKSKQRCKECRCTKSDAYLNRHEQVQNQHKVLYKPKTMSNEEFLQRKYHWKKDKKIVVSKNDNWIPAQIISINPENFQIQIKMEQSSHYYECSLFTTSIKDPHFYEGDIKVSNAISESLKVNIQPVKYTGTDPEGSSFCDVTDSMIKLISPSFSNMRKVQNDYEFALV